MPASMNHTERQPEVTMPLRVVSQENGLSRDMDVEQGTPSHNEGSERNAPAAGNCRWELNGKNILIVILALLALLALIFIPLYFVQRGPLKAQTEQLEAQIKQSEAQIKQLEVQIKHLEAQIKQSEVASTPQLNASCPRGWIQKAELCYFFSNNESTWNLSLSYCSLAGGSLAVMTTPEEMDFINQNKEPSEYWIGLQRNNTKEPWKQPDGTEFEPWYEIKGEGLCATLNDGVVSSTDCNSLRHWVCRRSLHAA